MAETDQERTEDPTPRRLQKAREKGQVPRSKEMGTAFVLVSAAVGLMIFGGSLATAMGQIMQDLFTLDRQQMFDSTKVLAVWETVLAELLWPLMWLFLLITAATFVGNIWLGGFNFSWQAAAPKLSKMNPLKGLKRMFGVQALVELTKGVAKFGVVAISAFLLLWWQFDNIMQLSASQLPAMVRDSLEIFLLMFLLLCCSVFLIVVIDAPYQLWKHTKDLRMTKQEVKDEHKDTEGSPEVKGRIRRLQMEMAMRRMMTEVPKADVIVTNPTHYAVALKYDDKGQRAPVLVAKGIDEIASKIREIAYEYDIPIVSSPALARSMYHTTELDQEIPQGLFLAVAQILAYVYQLKAYQRGQGKRPRPPKDDFDIPETLRH